MHSADYAVARCPSVCLSAYLSVRPSVTRRYSIETAKHNVSSNFLATPFKFFQTKRYDNVPRGILQRGRRMHGYEKNRNFQPASRVIWEMMHMIHSYYGMPIGNRTQAFEWYHFLPRDAMYKRGLPSCGVCVTVCLSVTFLDCVKTNKRSIKIFHLRVATSF